MSGPSGSLILPARVSTQDLALRLELDLEEVQAVLRSRGEPSAPEDVLGAELAIAVA